RVKVNYGTRRDQEGEGEGKEKGRELRRYPGGLLGDRDPPREARGAEVGSAERELQDAAVAARQVHCQGMRQGHSAVAESESLAEVFEGPKGLRADLVREDGFVRVPADGQGEGKAQGVGFVAVQDRGDAGQDLRLEGMDVAFPRPGPGLRVLEQRGQAPLLDNETCVEPSQFEGDRKSVV